MYVIGCQGESSIEFHRWWNSKIEGLED